MIITIKKWNKEHASMEYKILFYKGFSEKKGKLTETE